MFLSKRLGRLLLAAIPTTSVLAWSIYSSYCPRYIHTSSSFFVQMTSSSSSSSSPSPSTSSSSTSRCGIHYPELVVFDADACLWDQEVYVMQKMPSETVQGDLNGQGQGVTGVMSGRNQICLHKGSLIALQEHAANQYPGMKICIASSADTPFAERIARATLKLLEVVPGMTVWDLIMRDWNNVDVNQIGRQPPLSSNKAKSHFPRIREATGIRYDKMLFFDDCIWADHCEMVAAACKEEDTGKGPATVRTPYGLGEKEWRQGLKVYKKHVAQN